MLKIGITGGIGTGKSTVCRVFEALGIPTFDADKEAKALYNTSLSLKEKVIARYGSHVYRDDMFQREEMAKIVFNDAQALADLNALVHPLVIEQGDAWFANQNTTYAIKEAALLIESGGYKKLDKLILVQAPLAERIRRVKERDHRSEQDIVKRIEEQMPEEEKISYADYFIKNDRNDFIIDQVLDIHSKIKAL